MHESSSSPPVTVPRDPPDPAERRKGLLSAFTVFHWLMVLPFLLPYGPLGRLLPVSGLYLRALGTRQGWYMFAGGPDGSQHLVMRVQTASGGEQTVELPPVSSMGHLQAWVDYRFRELEHRLISGHPIAIRDPVPVYEAVARWAAAQVPGAVGVTLQVCGLPSPSLEESRAAGRNADWTARLRDPAVWTCEDLHHNTLSEGQP